MAQNLGNGIFHSHSRYEKLGMKFSTRIPIPENWELNFTLAFPFKKLEMEFSWEFPVPENREWNFPLAFLFPLRMEFSTGIPVPENWLVVLLLISCDHLQLLPRAQPELCWIKLFEDFVWSLF